MSRISRRALLKAAGGSAIAAAVLSPFRHVLTSRAAADDNGPRKRIVVVFSPNGTIHDQWLPTGTGSDFTLGRILAPLERHRAQLMVLSGMGLHTTMRGPGDEHQRGVSHVMTAMPLLPGGMPTGCDSCPPVSWASGPSIDQVIADTIGQSTRLRSLELGVANSDVESVKTRLAYRGSGQPLPPTSSPWTAWTRLFGGLTDPDAAMTQLAARRSVLDHAVADFTRVSASLAPDDRPLLDQHLETIRDIELRLAAPGPQGAACAPPNLGDPVSNLESAADYPRLVELQNDVMSMALACGLTNVGSILWNSSVGQQTFPSIGVTDPHHTLSHRSDMDTAAQESLTLINTWYAEQVAGLGDRLAALTEPLPNGDSRTLLDSTLVVWVNELGKGNVHSLTDVPFVMLGNVPNMDYTPHFATGRHVPFDDAAHGDFWVSVLNAMGDPRTSFGLPEYCNGPLPGLTT